MKQLESWECHLKGLDFAAQKSHGWKTLHDQITQLQDLERNPFVPKKSFDSPSIPLIPDTPIFAKSCVLKRLKNDDKCDKTTQNTIRLPAEKAPLMA